MPCMVVILMIYFFVSGNRLTQKKMLCSIIEEPKKNMSSVPRSLRYDLLSQAAPCRTWTSQFYAENGQTFREGSSTWITIPSGGQNQFLAPDVRLCFSVTNTSEQMITLDGQICSAISKLEVYCGSNLLVSVQEYGALFSMLYDMQAPSTHRSTAGKLLGVSDTARMGEPIANYSVR